MSENEDALNKPLGAPNLPGQAQFAGFRRVIPLCLLLLLVVLGGYLRFEGLGIRSLWRDELCTWHVSRMDLGDSLQWGPELTKPPLYQFALRLFTQDPHPSEWILRFPAAMCGILVVVLGWWFGRAVSGPYVGVALAGLLACNALQIEYSREARPYSMLVLGSLLSTFYWYRMVTAPRRHRIYAYTVTTVLTLYANYLAIFTIFAHGLWWLAMMRKTRPSRQSIRPLAALIATGVLCLPLVYRYLHFKSSMFQGLEWIKPPTWSSALCMLGQLTFGGYWVFALLIPAALLWGAGAFGLSLKRLWRPGGPLFTGRNDICGLLLLWWLGAWFGLLLISWIAHPAMVPRYALPASVPALLLPLIMAYRLDRRAPLLIMLVFVWASTPDWSDRQVDPGLRELAAFLNDQVDRQSEAVVLTIDNTIYPGGEDSERLGFQYYPMDNVPVTELYLESDGITPKNRALEDPRGLYLVVLWADPFPILQAAGREDLSIWYEGDSYSQLPFTPYRLVRVASLLTTDN